MVKRKAIILIIFCFIHLSLFSKTEFKYRLIFDFWSNPIFYESRYRTYGFSFNGSLMNGVKVNNITIGLEIFENYYSMASQSNIDTILIGWNIIRVTAAGYYEILDWMEIKWGFGGSWYSSSFIRSDIGVIGQNKGGLSFICDLNIRPVKFMQIQLKNMFDLFFEGKTITPYYYGGVRLSFNPGIDIINFYIETMGMPWIYKNEKVDLTTGMFVWSVGISIDISFPYKSRFKIEKKVKSYEKAKDGDIIILDDIFNNSASDIVDEDSLKILGEVIKVMKTRSNINIAIKSYTKYNGEPKKEIKLSKVMADTVKKFLVNGGVNANRIKLYTFGGFYSYFKKNKANAYENRIEIRVYESELF